MSDDRQDCARDAIALLRAYNRAGGQLDEDARVILENAYLPGLAEMLLALAYASAASCARLTGCACASDEDLQAAIDSQVGRLQVRVIERTVDEGGALG